MAPISLKDPNIQGITEEFVKALTGFKKSSRNFTLSVQFALSNFRFHQYLDVNSQKVERNIDGVCQKLNIHSQSEKAEILRDLCNRFLNAPLTSKSQESKTDAHYSLLLLLLTLADSPTNVDYTPLPPQDTSEEEWFDWKSYLLDGEEEEIIGLPNQQYLDWSDEEDEELELASGCASSLDYRQLASTQDQFERGTENGVTDRQSATSSIFTQDRGWISDQIVAQYWQESIHNLHHTDGSERSNCSLAGSWDSYQNGRNPLYQSNCNQTLTETQIVRETLCPQHSVILPIYWNLFMNTDSTFTETVQEVSGRMLSGAQNTFVYRHVHQNGTLDVKHNIQVLHLTPEGLSVLLSSFAMAGQQIFSLRKFVSSVLDPETKSTQTLQAFANALSCYFEEYKALLSSIEKDIVKQDVSVSLLLLQNKLQKTLDEISSLHRIYQAAFMETEETNNAQITCRILTILYKSIVQTDGHGGAAKWKVCLLLKIFLQSVEPCLRFIDEWVTSGHVCDPHDEFFIERIQAISVDSSSFWSDGVIFRCANQPSKSVVPCFLQDFVNQIFQAGKSVELIQGLGKMGELHSLRTKGSLYQEFLDQLLTALSSNPSSEETVDHSLQDKNDGTSLIDVISDSEQVASVIDDTGDHVLMLSFMNSSLNDQNSQRSATAGKLENICSGVFNLLKPVEVLLKECLAPLILDSCTQASCSIIELLKTDFCLLDHLAAMRHFFLLEAGDVMHKFYVEIFKKVRLREVWQDISFLNSLIQEALQLRFPEAVERLVVSLSSSGSKSHGQLGQSLHGMALNYRAPWPVNIVINSSCQKLYNLVFLFLLKVKQAKWSLDELRFPDVSTTLGQTMSDPFDEDETESKTRATDPVSTSPPDQGILHKMFVFRFKLIQFINSIHNHFMTRILHSTVLEFQEALDQAKDLDGLIKAHSSHVQKLYNRCLLSQKVGYLREVILKVLNLVLMFQTYWDNEGQYINEEKFKKIDEEFTKCSTFLVSCLENITKRGAFPHLESLAFALATTLSIPTKG